MPEIICSRHQRKRIYPTERDAKKALKTMRPHGAKTYYKCPRGDHFHLTSKRYH